MASKLFYEIDIDVLFDGASCKNVEVTFEKPTECANIRCEYTDKKILVEIPQDCTECVYANVRCTDDDCLICEETQRIKVCPCQGPEDCGACETCVDNYCVSTCKDGEFCDEDEDRCVECDDENPCPNNQVCNSGKCECPVDKPILNDKGVCVSCDEDNPCPPCTYCTPDGCKPKECTTGVCDDETGDCVECINSGDCTGENECCQPDKTCDCCPGFERDFDTGKCIPIGDCEEDIDCGVCEICDNDVCVPRECPKRYIPVEIDGVCECKKECDCDDATCSSSEACVPADANRCYCKECEGTCADNDDCGVGCICGDDLNCKPNPCKGSCENGADCGPGCGCDETTNECVPCNDQSCTTDECDKILGCGCIGTGCADIKGCDGPCSSHHDCSDGCTCWKGDCVPCDDFSCDNNDCANLPGCQCNGSNCEGDGDGDDCNDEFSLTKLDETCDLEASLSKEFGCSCSKLTLANKLTSVTTDSQNYFFNVLVEVRKGSVNSFSAVDTLPLLGDVSNENIAENELPSSGVVEVSVVTTYREVDVNGRFQGFSTGPAVNYSGSMIGKDQLTLVNVKIPIPGTRFSEFLYVEKVDVEVKQLTNFEFPNNCVYVAPKTINTFVVNSNSPVEAILAGNNAQKSVFGGFTTIESSSDRFPMFIWYKSTDDNYTASDIFRKLYVPAGTDGNFKDTLFGMAEINPDGKYPLVDPEGELWSNRYYSIKNDCGCDKDADIGKLVFCNPDELFYDLDECNNEITLLQPFAPCDVNQDISQWENTGYDIPNDVQTEYEFYLNGTLVATFVHNKNLGMIKKGSSDSMFDTYDIGEQITKIELKINHDDSESCTLTYTTNAPADVEVDKSINCDIVGDNYIVTVQKTGTGYTLDNLSISAGSLVNGAGSYILTLPKGQTTVLTYTFANGCVKQESLNEDCCEEFAVTISSNDVSCGGDLDLSYVVSAAGQAPFTVTYTEPNGTVSNGDASGNITYVSPSSGVYKVTVTDANGCVAKSSTTVDIVTQPTVVASRYNDICPGGTTNILVTVGASGVGGTVYYTANGSPSNFVVPSTGQFTIGPISTASTYVIDRIEVGGCTFQISEVINIAVLDEVEIDVTVSATTICAGSDVEFTITGGIPGCDVYITAGGVRVWEAVFDAVGGATAILSPASTVVYTIDSDCDVDCLTGLPVSYIITVVPGADINIVSESCDDTLTVKTITFDNVDSVVDQGGANIVVTGSSIDVNPDTVTSVTVTYDGGTCIVQETFAVTACECPEGTITLPDAVINLGESTLLNPVIGGDAVGPFSYAWSTGETSSSITVTPTTTTTYSLIVTSDVNACQYATSVTVTVVDCDGDLDSVTYQSCSCDGGDCTMRFTPNFTLDYSNCKIDEANTSITATVEGIGAVPVDIGNLTKLDFYINLNDLVGCPDPDDVTFAGTITFLDETSEACCDGTSIDIAGVVVARPGAGWQCTGC